MAPSTCMNQKPGATVDGMPAGAVYGGRGPWRVVIVSARGLRDADWFPGSGKSDPYVECTVKNRPHAGKIRTEVENSTLNPVWNHEGVINDFGVGDILVFSVYDKDLVGSNSLGSVELTYANCQQGFDGELLLENAGNGIRAYLRVLVMPGGVLDIPSVPISAVRPIVTERVVDVPQVVEKDIVVEVPEVYHNKVLNYVPSVTRHMVAQDVEVPEICWVEKPEFVAQWREEEVVKNFPKVTVREVLRPVPKEVVKEEEEIVDVPMQYPVSERIIHNPSVQVKEKLHYVKGSCEVRETSETVNITHTVPVPQINVVPKVETRECTKQVVVPHVLRTERIVEEPQEQVVECDVEVPLTHTVKTIKYVPQFVDGPDETSRLLQGDRFDYQWEGTRASMYIEQLQAERDGLQRELELKVRRTVELQEVLQREQRSKREMAYQLDATREMMSSMTTRPGSLAFRHTTAPGHVATVGLDVNRDGRADYMVTGTDWNRDGIPDALQQKRFVQVPVQKHRHQPMVQVSQKFVDLPQVEMVECVADVPVQRQVPRELSGSGRHPGSHMHHALKLY